MADLLQALAADLISQAGVDPAAPIADHPDLLRRYNELGKIIQVWHTEGDKTAVRREANLIKAQLSYNKEVIGAQQSLNRVQAGERNAALKALTDMETAIMKSQTDLGKARNAQSEYIMHKVKAAAGRPGTRGSAAIAWSELVGVLNEEGMIGRIPEPAIPLVLQRMKNTYGVAGLGRRQKVIIEDLEARATKATASQENARKQMNDSLRSVQELRSRARTGDDAELGRVIGEARKFGGNLALFMEGEVGLKNKSELQARLQNLQSESDTLGRMEEQHKRIGDKLHAGGGTQTERQKIADMISHPRFLEWAESNGHDPRRLGRADRGEGGALLNTYTAGPDDLKAVLHFQHQLKNPGSYSSMLSPFAQGSRSGKYVVVRDKVAMDNAERYRQKTGPYAGQFVTLDSGTGSRVLDERQYLEWRNKYAGATVFQYKSGTDIYAQSDGQHYKYLRETGKWAGVAEPPKGWNKQGMKPLMHVTTDQDTRFATLSDLREGGGKSYVQTEAIKNTRGEPTGRRVTKGGLAPASANNIKVITQSGGVIKPRMDPPVGSDVIYRGQLMTMHARDVLESRDKEGIDFRVHGPGGIKTFSGDKAYQVDIVKKGDETGFSDIVDGWLGRRFAKVAGEAADEAPGTGVTTAQRGLSTFNDHGNVDANLAARFGFAIDQYEGPEIEDRDLTSAVEGVPEFATSVEGVIDVSDPSTQAKDAPTPLASKLELGQPSGAPRVAAELGKRPMVPTPTGPSDVIGGQPFSGAQLRKREAVREQRMAQQGALDFQAGSVKTMPRLDRLREAVEFAEGKSEADPGNKALKQKARQARTAYKAAAKAEGLDRKELRRHEQGVSIIDIQAAKVPPAEVAEAPPAEAAPAAPAQPTTAAAAAQEGVLDAARRVGELEAGSKEAALKPLFQKWQEADSAYIAVSHLDQTKGGPREKAWNALNDAAERAKAAWSSAYPGEDFDTYQTNQSMAGMKGVRDVPIPASARDDRAELRKAREALTAAEDVYRTSLAAEAAPYAGGVVPQVTEAPPDADAELKRLRHSGFQQGRMTYQQSLPTSEEVEAVEKVEEDTSIDPALKEAKGKTKKLGLTGERPKPRGTATVEYEPMEPKKTFGQRLADILGIDRKVTEPDKLQGAQDKGPPGDIVPSLGEVPVDAKAAKNDKDDEEDENE